nr:MAG TPA: hypothetical protein [Caudoviricetes sp.]
MGTKGIEGPAIESQGTGVRGVLFRDEGFGGCPNRLGAIS